jgi:hypothetical protein
MLGLNKIEERIYKYAYARDWEFEFKGDLDSGTKVWELWRDGDSGLTSVHLGICKDGTIKSRYGAKWRELTIDEVEEIIRSSLQTDN